ncbi:uncharacterized protein BP01DRAFT_358005 [Aspergillus saccharolyticus JOP 1030-1]|uniref:F-box domain-containing protein n=1 Tax=Aspergillus saccharolyticus JOP 1030-1 TaxID=1450539 RepID=A0A318ZA27_9EURO|nr:hypothetical protein BP01DRAFT_358005 [Aspergillus saccharolyticus JOP 1030-1]PYH44109.1 hypothetical protein BP01DRAFT_358005 [Aspergillus saccharolyticus JOP 1030-1]
MPDIGSPSPELLYLILAHLGKISAASYTSICTKWQPLIEKRTFSYRLRTPDRFPEIARIVFQISP